VKPPKWTSGEVFMDAERSLKLQGIFCIGGQLKETNKEANPKARKEMIYA
jgi:hypothetical protein